MAQAARKQQETQAHQRIIEKWQHPTRLPRVGAVSHLQAMESNTGASMGAKEWQEGRARQAVLRTQTQQIAGILEACGIPARAPSQVQLVGEITGNVETAEAWRAIRFLPLVAQRDRRPVQAGLSFWLRTQPFARYAVVTSGARIPVGGDLKQRMKEHTANIRRWSSEAKERFDIELLFRATEFTINEDGVHLHSNIVYKPHRVLNAAAWNEFLIWSRGRLQAHWRDCGKLKDASEVVKYCIKPADLNQLDDQGLVWLFEQTYRAKLCQPLGSFAEWMKGLEVSRLKVAMVRDGEKSRLRLVEKAPHEPASGRGGEGENVILGRTLPQARWCQWAEPVSLVLNFTRDPLTPEGVRRLAVLNQRSEQAAGWWRANGAPPFMIYTVRPTVQTQTLADGTIIDFGTGEVLYEPPPDRPARQREQQERDREAHEQANQETEGKLREWHAGARARSEWQNVIDVEIKLRSMRRLR